MFSSVLQKHAVCTHVCPCAHVYPQSQCHILGRRTGQGLPYAGPSPGGRAGGLEQPRPLKPPVPLPSLCPSSLGGSSGGESCLLLNLV